MKRIIFIALSILVTQFAEGQTNPIDKLFDKYSGQDGVTTIFISSRMFSMMAGVELEDNKITDLMARLKSIRILTVEDSLLNARVNLYRELESRMTFRDYEELMVVKEGGSDFKFLVKGSGNRIDEFLMIGGGKNSKNILISIRGELSMNNISDISKAIGIKELEKLENNKKQ